MSLSPLITTHYLERIGLQAVPQVTETGLTDLHAAHVFSIPFENLDILLGRGIDLAPKAVFEKLVSRRRGGYCFEQNGLFGNMLSGFGFEVRPLLARVLLGGETSSRTHQVLLVELANGPWLADVGFGGGTLRRPIPLELETTHEQFGYCYRLVSRQDLGICLQTLRNGKWQDSYAFTFDDVLPVDIELGNHFTSTSPNTHFTQNRRVMMATPKGSKRLLDMDFPFDAPDGALSGQTVVEDGDYFDRLRDEFGIELEAALTDFRAVPSA